jgi:hypothetical protein
MGFSRRVVFTVVPYRMDALGLWYFSEEARLRKDLSVLTGRRINHALQAHSEERQELR